MSSSGALPSSGDKTYCFFVLQYEILQCFNWWFWMFNKIDDFSSCYDTTKLNVAKMDFDLELQQNWMLRSFFLTFHTLDTIKEIVSHFMLQSQILSTFALWSRVNFFDVSVSSVLVLVAPCRGNMMVCGGAPAIVGFVFWFATQGRSG